MGSFRSVARRALGSSLSSQLGIGVGQQAATGALLAAAVNAGGDSGPSAAPNAAAAPEDPSITLLARGGAAALARGGGRSGTLLAGALGDNPLEDSRRGGLLSQPLLSRGGLG